MGLNDRPVCVHASLRSFGQLEDGATTVIEAFLSEGCTLLVPTFTTSYRVVPPVHLRLARNGWNYELPATLPPTASRYYTPACRETTRDMGAIPAAILARTDCRRGNHPVCSFTAVGPLATTLIESQSALEVYAPLASLAAHGGYVALLGVDLTKMTLLHLAEKRAGRTLFRRWAYNPTGELQQIEVGSCSGGFKNLQPHLGPLAQVTTVGPSHWSAYPAQRTLDLTAEVIRAQPQITHCDDPQCIRCADAIAGGPILA